MSFQAWATSWSAYTVATSGRIVPSSSSRAILPSPSPDGASLIITPDTRWLAASSCDTGWVAATRWLPCDDRCLDSQILRVRAHSGGGTEHGIAWRTCRNVATNLFDDP